MWVCSDYDYLIHTHTHTNAHMFVSFICYHYHLSFIFYILSFIFYRLSFIFYLLSYHRGEIEFIGQIRNLDGNFETHSLDV